MLPAGWVLVLLAALLLNACSSQPPAPIEDRTNSSRVPSPPPAPDPAAEGEGVQVYPLQNPAVAELAGQAHAATIEGNTDQAAVLLERALRIDPRDPELLQQMAEVQLLRADYEQALGFAVRSYDSGPRVGELCVRNWDTIAVAKGHLGDGAGAREAQSRQAQCQVTRPQGM